MGRGRAPCCEKVGLKKGPWTPAEDMRLMAYIHKHGHGNWRALPKQAGLLRCGKSCRLRWINYLRPDVKRGNFTPEEEETIIKLHELLGNKWSKIASRLPGRTDNEIKNVWNTHLKKRLVSKESNPTAHKSGESSSSSSSNSSVSYCDQGEGIGHEEQVNTVINSKECDVVLMEERIEIAIEPDIWDMLEDGPCQLQETNDNELKDKWDTDNRSLSKGPNLLIDGPKQSLSPSSSSSTSNSYGSYSIPTDGKGPAEQTVPPLETGRLVDVLDIEHQEMKHDESNLETATTSLHLNLDFWGMLDDDLCFFPSTTVGPMGDQGLHQHTSEEEPKEVDSKMWISYLENELGLWATGGDDQQSQTNSTLGSLAPCPHYDGKLEVEIDPVITYFQSHPSSPAIFSL